MGPVPFVGRGRGTHARGGMVRVLVSGDGGAAVAFASGAPPLVQLKRQPIPIATHRPARQAAGFMRARMRRALRPWGAARGRPGGRLADIARPGTGRSPSKGQTTAILYGAPVG